MNITKSLKNQGAPVGELLYNVRKTGLKLVPDLLVAHPENYLVAVSEYLDDYRLAVVVGQIALSIVAGLAFLEIGLSLDSIYKAQVVDFSPFDSPFELEISRADQKLISICSPYFKVNSSDPVYFHLDDAGLKIHLLFLHSRRYYKFEFWS